MKHHDMERENKQYGSHDVPEMTKKDHPSLHLEHEDMQKLGFPQEHKPQVGDKYHMSGEVHVHSISEHESEGHKSGHVHFKIHHMGMERKGEEEEKHFGLYKKTKGYGGHEEKKE
jgi:hypothetical protein